MKNSLFSWWGAHDSDWNCFPVKMITKENYSSWDLVINVTYHFFAQLWVLQREEDKQSESKNIWEGTWMKFGWDSTEKIGKPWTVNYQRHLPCPCFWSKSRRRSCWISCRFLAARKNNNTSFNEKKYKRFISLSI